MPTTSPVTIVTGASRGIGAAVARHLAGATKDHPGAPPPHLVISYASNEQAARSVANQVRDLGALATVVQCDVAREGDVLAMFAMADQLGRLVGLVNNAGILFEVTTLENLTVERLEQVWAVNITGSFVCAREAVKRMATDNGGQGGSIVNISSRASTFGSPNEFTDYAASKGAVDTMTLGLATEVARRGIRVNAVRPGLIDTDIHIDAGRPNRVAELADRIPLGRGGKPEEVANMVGWLLSDESSYVTGALFDIGGGR